MASLSSRGNNNQKRQQQQQQQQQSSGWWLLPLLLALTALHMQSWASSVEALPITSRPIEGNAQGEAWKAWLRLSDEQRTLEKPKKVMPKSIFALPFRHCPPGHKLYNERCIPQININPTDIVAQELQGQLGEHGGSQFGFTDYDYSDSESDELIYELPLGPLIQNEPITTLTSPSGAEDQALPSEDAPLKFNIFEKKFPTTPDDPVQPQPDAVNATTPAAATATTVATTATTPTPTPMATPTPSPTIATLREDNNRITSEAQDLLADASNTWPSTTSLSIPSTSSTSSNIAAFSDIGNIDAIVVPAGVSLHSKESMVQLVTSSMSDEPNANADTNSRPTTDTDTDTDADADTETESESEAEAEAEAEADLEQFLKVDAFQPADVNMMPLFSHRRIAPLLSADLDGDDVTATDIVPTELDDDDVATTTTATEAATTPTTAILSSTQAQVPGEEQEIDESDLKKSKVQPVQLVTTAATAATAATKTTAATTATIASISTPTTTATTTTSETEVAAIHQDANGNKRDDDDRFYYHHFVRNAAASGSSSSSTTSTTSKTNNADSDLDVLNDMASSENLMTNTIGGQGEGDSERKAASEINFEQELRIINELVKGKRRLSQLRQHQQQQQHEPSTSTSSSSSSSSSSTAIPTTTTTIAIIESSSNAFSTTATSSDATTATAETTTFWSKLMPTLSQSSTAEAAAAATTTTTAETITTTPAAAAAAATLIAANVADSSIATTPAATTATTAFVSTQHLSINPNRSNMNSKIIRIDSTHDYPQTTKTTTPSPPATTLDTLPTDESYTPFWWLPSIGWRLDRQVDEKGEDRSLLLRLFRTFRATNDSDTTTAVTTTTTAETAATAAAILP